MSITNHLIEDVVRFLNVKHDVQFTHILKVFVQGLDQIVDELKICHLILHQPIITYSSMSSPMIKNSEAYLLYTTL